MRKCRKYEQSKTNLIDNTDLNNGYAAHNFEKNADIKNKVDRKC